MTSAKLRPFVSVMLFISFLVGINSSGKGAEGSEETPSGNQSSASINDPVGLVIFDKRIIKGEDGKLVQKDDIYYIPLKSVVNRFFGDPSSGGLVKKSCEEQSKEIYKFFNDRKDGELKSVEDQALNQLIKNLDKVCINSRWINKSDDLVTVIVAYNGDNKPYIQFKEDQRDPTFVTDLNTVFTSQSKLIKPLAAKFVQPQPPNSYVRASHKIKYKKGKIEIDVMQPNELISAQLTTGTTDAFFISLDVPIASGNDFQNLDSLNNYYYGFNLMLTGDALAENVPGVLDACNGNFGIARLFFKAMIQNSDKPFNSFGGGLGYKDIDFWQNSIPVIGKWIKHVSPFVSAIYTKEDSVNGTDKTKYSTGARFGLSIGLH